MHVGAIGSIDGRPGGPGSHSALSAAELCRLLDCTAYIPKATQSGYPQHGSRPAGERYARRRSRLFFERAAIVGANAPGGGRAALASGRRGSGDLFAGQGRVGTRRGKTAAGWRQGVALAGGKNG